MVRESSFMLKLSGKNAGCEVFRLFYGWIRRRESVYSKICEVHDY